MREKTIDVKVVTERMHTRDVWLDKYRGKVTSDEFDIEYEMGFKKPYLEIIQSKEEFLDNTSLEAQINGIEVKEEDKDKFKEIIVEMIYEHIGYFEESFGTEGSPYKPSEEAVKYVPEHMRDGSPVSEQEIKEFVLSARTGVDRDRLLQYLEEVNPAIETEYKVRIGEGFFQLLEKYRPSEQRS